MNGLCATATCRLHDQCFISAVLDSLFAEWVERVIAAGEVTVGRTGMKKELAEREEEEDLYTKRSREENC